MRRFVVLTTALACWGSLASAQSEEWVVVPIVTTNDTAWIVPTVSTMGSALSQQGVDVLSPERAVTEFEARGSATSTQVTDTDIEEWVARSRDAIRHLARGDYATALKELKEAQTLSRKAVDELNREQNRAQNVLDTCLYMVRALLETGNRSRAKAQVQECVRLVPAGEPSSHMHPPNVVALYNAASEPGPEQTGALAVSSEPSGCTVRINGVGFGETPFEIADLYPGEYQVQVECEPRRRGRVHRITVREGRAEMFVDVAFDRAVHTEPVLWLRYSDESSAQRQTADAQQIARVLRAGAVVLVSRPTPETMELRVVSGTKRRGGVARVPATSMGPTASVAAEAASALAAGQCKDFTGSKPVTIDCGAVRAKPQKRELDTVRRRPPRGQFIAGLTLLTLGGASLATTYGLTAARRSAGNDWVDNFNVDPTDLGPQTRWTNLGNGLVFTSIAGGALTTAAMPLVLPYREKPPWWAWLSGGLGVGAAVASIVSAATAHSIPDGTNRCQQVSDAADAQGCVDRNRSTDRAIALGVTAAPLLTIPLVYLLRRSEKRGAASLAPELVVGRAGGSLGFRGEF